MINWTNQSRSAKAVSLMLLELQRLGYDKDLLLSKTRIPLELLEETNGEISFDQEVQFFHNIVEHVPDRAVGLKLGSPFVPQSYGMFGYALLSATSILEAFNIAANFGRLTFSLYTFECEMTPLTTELRLTRLPALSEPISSMLSDRDLAASIVAINMLRGQPVPLEEVHLTHKSYGLLDTYQTYFGCKVICNANVAKVVVNNDYALEPLPNRDPISVEHFKQQCQLLIAKLSSKSQFIDRVRMEMLSKPGFIPDIEFVANKFAVSPRTLRRRLKDEGSSYTDIVDEIRYRLAREYLEETELPLSEIARLLDYTESGNFTHAFKRWSGLSPLRYRKQLDTNLKVIS